MTEKKINSQNKIIKESIFISLMILMKTKKFNDISITEITNKAGVSRMAYYRNYNFKEDIIIEYLDELFEEYTKEILRYKKSNIYEYACLYFTYFRRHEKLITNLINSNLTYLILERYDKYLEHLFQNILHYESESPEQKKYSIEYSSGGLYKVLITWIKDGLKESDEEMAKIMVNLITN